MLHGRCIEQMVWDDGPDLLGRGGKVYLDSNTGSDGCNYGVHHQTGWFYPCKQQWRFFNLQGAGGHIRSGGYRLELPSRE